MSEDHSLLKLPPERDKPLLTLNVRRIENVNKELILQEYLLLNSNKLLEI